MITTRVKVWAGTFIRRSRMSDWLVRFAYRLDKLWIGQYEELTKRKTEYDWGCTCVQDGLLHDMPRIKELGERAVLTKEYIEKHMSLITSDWDCASPNPLAKQVDELIETTEQLPCGCTVTKGWRCPVHNAP